MKEIVNKENNPVKPRILRLLSFLQEKDSVSRLYFLCPFWDWSLLQVPSCVIPPICIAFFK